MIKLTPAAENAFLIQFADKVSEDLPARIAGFMRLIETELGYDIISMTPAYTTLQVLFDSQRISSKQVEIKLMQLLEKKVAATWTPVTHTFPVCYSPDLASDLLTLCNVKGLSVEQLIQLHCNRHYQVYAVGFLPCFAYLGLLDKRLHHPRHATPRLSIPAGSVAIADNQTAIYPTDSPAGWQIIGRTPLDLSPAKQQNLTRFSMGDKVQFEPITLKEYNRFAS